MVFYDQNTGKMLYGNQCIDGNNYYFNTFNGAMLTGFVNKDDGNKIYYGNDGKQKYGEEKINNKWYYFDEKTGNLTTALLNCQVKLFIIIQMELCIMENCYMKVIGIILIY